MQNYNPKKPFIFLLDVERRRIYDIMNVLESLHMVNRLAKNKYTWHGCHNLNRTLQVLKKVAEENKYLQQIQLIKKREDEEEPEGNDQRIELVVKDDIPSNHMDLSFVELPGMEFRGGSSLLCFQNYVNTFLSHETLFFYMF